MEDEGVGIRVIRGGGGKAVHLPSGRVGADTEQLLLEVEDDKAVTWAGS
jgi:hypothetical protein